MALWMPYAEDSALDLTKTTLKQEREYNSSPSSSEQSYGYAYLPHTSQPEYLTHIGYPYPNTGFTVPSIQMSPISGGSTCYGYDAAQISPTFAVKPGTLSPPESPVSQPSRLSYIDVDALSDDPDFQAFERNALRAMAEKNGGTLLGNNPRMRRAVRSMNQDAAANDVYRKQRERNNAAAKQSRDRRKLREIHLALKVSYLKNEVATLKAKLASKVCSRCQQLCVC